MKHELLAPAGDMECLRQAVFNGCDAVYLACKSFGARKFATNFMNEEIVEAIRFCHLYGVRVYVTMNTLVKDSEVASFLEQASFLHQNGVDALIVQDFGMICLLREKYPNLEIHASTQANTSSKETCRLFYDLGVKRVVFSRELSIDEIDSIDVPIEKEAFIHGALCISYSGCCLMSSMLGGRSGNRGECAGSCRMPFTLMEKDKVLSTNQYLLSTKELNTTTKIQRLLESSIDSFKIEGRMKGPLYVGFITRFYRKLIDGEAIDFKKTTDELKTIFNREFTVGRLFGEADSHLMNTKSPNHIGLEIGKVVEVRKDKIKIQLKKGYELNQYDAIRFLHSKKGCILNYLYDELLKLVNHVDDVCYIDNKVGLEENDVVMKTQDFLLGKSFEEILSKKIAVSFEVFAHLGEPLEVSICDGVHTLVEEVDCIQQAVNAPISSEMIEKQLKKLGETPFSCEKITISMDEDIFIQVRDLNEVRRNLVTNLISLREEEKVPFLEKKVSFEKFHDRGEHGLSAFVYHQEQLDECLKLGVSYIYVNSLELYEKYKEYPNVYLGIERCSFSIEENLQERNFVSDYFHFQDFNVRGNYSFNVFNIYTAYYLRKLGLKCIPLSVELSPLEVNELVKNYKEKFGSTNFEVLVYGSIENMIIKGNVLDIKENSFAYNLIDFKKRSFPVYYDGKKIHILNWEKRNLEKISNVNFSRLDFYQENREEIKKIVKNYE